MRSSVVDLSPSSAVDQESVEGMRFGFLPGTKVSVCGCRATVDPYWWTICEYCGGVVNQTRLLRTCQRYTRRRAHG